jgi:hypothetical protein
VVGDDRDAAEIAPVLDAEPAIVLVAGLPAG